MQVTARLYAREKIAKLGLAPLTSMFAFGENQPGPRRLPPRGPRLRRPVDPARQWRMDLAPAGQSAPLAGHVVRHHQPARLRPDAARPLAGQLRRSRGAVRAAAERLGRADRRLGRRAGRVGADPDARRDQRQYRRFLGPAGLCGARQAVRHRLPASAGKAQARRLPTRAGPCRRDAAAASSSVPTATSTTWSISTGRRCARWRRPPRSNRSSGSMPMPRCASATCSRTRSPAPGA